MNTHDGFAKITLQPDGGLSIELKGGDAGPIAAGNVATAGGGPGGVATTTTCRPESGGGSGDSGVVVIASS